MFTDSKRSFELATQGFFFRLCVAFLVKTWKIHSLHSSDTYVNVNTITEPRNMKELKPRNPINRKHK